MTSSLLWIVPRHRPGFRRGSGRQGRDTIGVRRGVLGTRRRSQFVYLRLYVRHPGQQGAEVGQKGFELGRL
jgi:hypothetical protein